MMRQYVLPVLLGGVPFLVEGCGGNPATPTRAETGQATLASSETGSVASAGVRFKRDQSNEVTDQLGLGNGRYGQTFVPKAKNLARVDLRLMINTLTADVGVAVELRAGLLGPALASTNAVVAAAGPGELSRMVAFSFNPPVALQKGTLYTIVLDAPQNVSWEFAYDDPYPHGAALIFDGTALNPPADFVFATYEMKQ